MQTPSTPSHLSIPAPARNAFRILIVSGRDGSGKTTLSTNLAAWLAYRDQATGLLGIDPQNSAQAWLAQRSAQLPPVHNMATSGAASAPAVEWLITDAATANSRQALNDLLLDHHLVIVPLVVSEFDSRSNTAFIGELLLTPEMRRRRRPLAVIANRVKQPTESWERLQKFLTSLNIAYPATLRDSQNYPRAYREGQGVVDYQQQAYLRDRADWEALVQWLDQQYAEYVSQQNSADLAPAPLISAQ